MLFLVSLIVLAFKHICVFLIKGVLSRCKSRTFTSLKYDFYPVKVRLLLCLSIAFAVLYGIITIMVRKLYLVSKVAKHGFSSMPGYLLFGSNEGFMLVWIKH